VTGTSQLPSVPEATAAQEVIVGVDTHKDFHVAAVITELGALLGSKAFPATRAGYRSLLRWARGFGAVQRAGVECTGSYGAALARHLAAAQVEVVEVSQPDKATRRRRGKTDAIDAEAAARAVLTGRATALAKTADGPVEMLRMFKLAKASAVKSRSQAINQLKAVLITADAQLRDELSGLSTIMLIRHSAGLTPVTPADAASAAVYTLRLLARRIGHLTQEIADLDAQITAVLAGHHPQLLATYGAGPDTAAALIIAAGDNAGRLRSEASFAALCGASPVEASSGKTRRHRPQPRRRPAGQPRPAHHRAVSPALGPAQPQLPGPAHSRGEDTARGDPVPEAIRGPRDLPPHDLP
jgi:transposase